MSDRFALPSAPRLLILLLVAVLAGACATRSERAVQRASAQKQATAPAAPRVAAWPLFEMDASAAAVTVVLRDDTRDVATLPGGAVRSLAGAAYGLSRGAGWQPDFLVTEGHRPNAFAFYLQGRPTVAVTLGMIDLLGDDGPAWAALLGHEMAHFALRHRERRAERRETVAASSTLLGFGLSMLGIPFGGLVGNATTTAVERSFDRDEEREADRAGVALMLSAGYEPEGAVRLQAALLRASAGAALPFFSTHPGGSERVADMQALVDAVRRDGAASLPMPPVVPSAVRPARAAAVPDNSVQ